MCFSPILSSLTNKRGLVHKEFSQMKIFDEFKTSPIEDDYICYKKLLGQGAHGKVWQCKNIKEKRLYALKALEKSKKSLNEIRLQIMASENCDHIVKIKDVYTNEKYYYVVMEYMAGGELLDRISRDRSFNQKKLAKIMFQICTAVEHLYNLGIAHRDLKSENILFSSNDDDAVVKLTDFGFAKEIHAGLNSVVYTLDYAPPEILKIEKRRSFSFLKNNYDISCDIWCLGVLMYLLCYGKLPFSGEHPFQGLNQSKIDKCIKKRILRGKYALNNEDLKGNNLTEEILFLIKGMIELEPAKRLNIKQIMANKWIREHDQVPRTRIKTNRIKAFSIKKSILFEYDQTLTQMRIDDEAANFKLKNLDDANNPLLRKRQKLQSSPNTLISDNS